MVRPYCGEDHVGGGQQAGEAFERLGAHLVGRRVGQAGDHRIGSTRGAVGDHHAGGTVTVQCLGHPLPHLARADHQDPGTGQAVLPPICAQGDCPVGKGGDATGDGRLRPDPLAGFDRVTEERTEYRSRHPLELGLLPRSADLAQDLRLTQHGRVQAGGHREEMFGHVVVEADGEMLGQRVDGAAADRGQELLELGDTVMEPLDHGVDLGAQARGEDDHLGQIGLVPQPAEGLRQRALGHRHPLEQIEGGVALLEADDDHRHSCTASARPCISSLFTGSRSLLVLLEDGPASARPSPKSRA